MAEDLSAFDDELLLSLPFDEEGEGPDEPKDPEKPDDG